MMLVGLVGCGALGCALAGRLLRAGHSVTVHDRERARAASLLELGARWADRSADLAAASEIFVSALPHPEDVESVFLGDGSPWKAAAPRTLHLETSTVGLGCTHRLAEAAATSAIRFLDAPVSRGRIREDGMELVAWVGSAADALDCARPALEAMTDRVVYCGGVGHGQITKLLNNLIAHSLTVIASEALALGVKAGASLELLAGALQHGTGQNRVLDELLPGSVFRGDWRPGLRLDLAIKDLGLASDLAQRHDVPLQALDRLRDLYERASRRGWDDLSAHAVVRLIEEASGVELRFAGATPASEDPD